MMYDTQRTIWVVEDDEVLAEIAAFRLEMLGYHVVAFQHGEQVLAAVDPGAEPSAPDLIVLDLGIRNCDSYRLVSQLKRSLSCGDTPILVFSSDGELNVVQRAFAAGAADFLATPFDPVVLEDKIQSLLNHADPARI